MCVQQLRVLSPVTNICISEDKARAAIVKRCLEPPSGRPPVTSLTFSILVWTETSDPGVSCGLGSILLRSAPLELLTTKCSLCANTEIKLKSKTIWAEKQQPKSVRSAADSLLEDYETWLQYSWRLHQKTYLSFLFLSVKPPKDSCQNNSLLSRLPFFLLTQHIKARWIKQTPLWTELQLLHLQFPLYMYCISIKKTPAHTCSASFLTVFFSNDFFYLWCMHKEYEY